MTKDDEVWFVLTFGGLFFGLSFISVVGQVYLYFFQMRKILSCLSSSRGVLMRKSSLSRGLFGAYLMFVCVGSYLVLPSWAIRGGSLDESDYLNFPCGLLCAIRFFYLAALGGGIAMIILLVGCKYMGWIE